MDDDEDIIPEIEQATQHYCDKNNCEDLPATQLLKIKVIISLSWIERTAVDIFGLCVI